MFLKVAKKENYKGKLCIGKERDICDMASFPTCANPDGEEEVGDAGGKHGEGKTLDMET